MTVDRSQRVGLCSQKEAFAAKNGDFQMAVPDAFVLKGKMVGRGPADPDRKMAGHPVGACLPSRKNLELDHYRMLFGTWITSPG